MSSRAQRGSCFTRSFAALRRSFARYGLLVIAACEPTPTTLTLAVDTTRGTRNTAVVMSGLTRSELDEARGRIRQDGSRNGFRVTVKGDSTPIVGRYDVLDSTIVFRPAFPFDPGREYQVRVDRDRVTTRPQWVLRPETLTFRLPSAHVPSTRIAGVFPSDDVLPENQLRFYIQFSAPMSRGGGLPHVRLLEADGREVKEAFLPIEAEFWNHEHTRYTLFLDPGRVKRGILPNEQAGRALVAGRRYAIVVDSAWRDGNGQPLISSHVKNFLAGPADYKPITLDAWRVSPPRQSTRDALVIRFNEPLDFALLQRAVGVEREDGTSVEGEVKTAAAEHEWRFFPARPWPAGDHRVLVLDFLEDLAGNRVNRAFEVDMFTHSDSTTRPSRYTIPFRIR